MIETLKCVGLVLFVLGTLLAPQWYRLYYRIRYGRRYVVEDSGR